MFTIFKIDSQILQNDYEIGHFLRSRIIPKALLYYTGDIVDDEDDFDVSNKFINLLIFETTLAKYDTTTRGKFENLTTNDRFYHS